MSAAKMVLKLTAHAHEVAKSLYEHDPRTASFMRVHLARTGDPAARLMLTQLSGMPMKAAGSVQAAGGVYGFPSPTARAALAACVEVTAKAGELAFKANALNPAGVRSANTFLARSAALNDPAAILIRAASAEHLKEHQFTEENNPNPKGTDADGDGKTDEKPDFLKDKKASSNRKAYWSVRLPRGRFSKWHDEKSVLTRGAWSSPAQADAWADRNIPGLPYDVVEYKDVELGIDRMAADFDPEEIGEEESGPLESDAAYLKGRFTQENLSNVREFAESGKKASRGTLRWSE